MPCRSIAIVKIREQWSIAFGEPNSTADLWFSDRLDHWNFREMPAGTVFGSRRPGSSAQLSVCNEQDQDVSSAIFALQDDNFVLRRSVVPAMLTLNIQIIRDDCLGYLMEEYPLPVDLLIHPS